MWYTCTYILSQISVVFKPRSPNSVFICSKIRVFSHFYMYIGQCSLWCRDVNLQLYQRLQAILNIYIPLCSKEIKIRVKFIGYDIGIQCSNYSKTCFFNPTIWSIHIYIFIGVKRRIQVVFNIYFLGTQMTLKNMTRRNG